jgi:hypothetical protein
MFLDAKHSWTFGGLIAADPFKDAGTVMERMRQDMDVCVIPVDQFTVAPNFFCGCNHPELSAKEGTFDYVMDTGTVRLKDVLSTGAKTI